MVQSYSTHIADKDYLFAKPNPNQISLQRKKKKKGEKKIKKKADRQGANGKNQKETE